MALTPVAGLGERIYRSVASSRTCLLIPSPPPVPAEPPPAPPWLHAVGILALAAQGWLG
jgi:hypothetical protein